MRILLLVAALVLAGCAKPQADAPDPVVPTPDLPLGTVVHLANGTALTVPTTAQAVLRYTGLGAIEPTLGVGPDGTVSMTAVVRGPTGISVPTVVASKDGSNWTDIGPYLAPGVGRHPVTTDPYVHVDPATGRVFTADLIHNCTFLSWTDDGGATWLTNPNGCGPPGILDHQTYVTAAPRVLTPIVYPRLLYVCGNEITHADCAVSLDGGITFGPQRPVFVVPPGQLCSALTGHLASAPDGRVYLPTTTCATGRGAPVLHRTEDDGLTWTAHVVTADETLWPHDGDHDVAVAVDDQGTVFANWIDRAGRVRLAWSTDFGATWSPPADVTVPGVTAAAYNQVAAAGAGNVSVVYLGTRAEGGYVEQDGGSSPELHDSEAPWHAFLAVGFGALDGNLTLHTSQATPDDDPIAVGTCGRERCGDLTDFIGLEVGPDGRPWASMVDVCAPECGGDGRGAVVTLRVGPSLRGGELAPLP